MSITGFGHFSVIKQVPYGLEQGITQTTEILLFVCLFRQSQKQNKIPAEISLASHPIQLGLPTIGLDSSEIHLSYYPISSAFGFVLFHPLL